MKYRIYQTYVLIGLAFLAGVPFQSSVANTVKSDLVKSLESVFYAGDFARIPGEVFPSRDYGAVADGETDNTEAIQSAIDAASDAGGGVVTLPKGVVVSGSIFLKSNVELRLDEGVVLQATHDESKYKEIWSRVAGIEMHWPAALVNVYEQENVRISGKGVIDGNGEFWWHRHWGEDRKGGMMADYNKRGMRWALAYDNKRVRPILVHESKAVLLKDITIKRAGFWTITLTYSERCHVDGIIIRNNIGGHGPSTDGINVDSSSDVLIENCDVDCNDDNFCLKSGRDSDGLRVNRPTKNVVIRNSKTGPGLGLIAIGSDMSGGVRNVEVYGLKGEGTTNGIRFKSSRIRGGVVSNLWYHDIEMNGVKRPFSWNLDWFPQFSVPDPPEDIPESEWPDHWHVLLTEVTPPEKGIPEFRDVRISNVTVTGANTAFNVTGHQGKPISNVVFENVDIQAKDGGSLRYCQDWTMDNVSLKAGRQVVLKGCKNVDLPEFKRPQNGRETHSDGIEGK